MYLRGTVVDADAVETVSTRYGDRDLAEVRLRSVVTGADARPTEAAHPDREQPPARTDPETVTDADGTVATLTLWGEWAETAQDLAPGITLAVTAATVDEWNGERTFATTGDSLVVVDPDTLIDVTAIRAWVQCPRIYYLNNLSGVPLKYPVVLGTVVHEVFGDLLRGRDREAAVADAVADAGLELGLLDRDAAAVREEVDAHARAIEGWLAQGTLTGDDDWRSERTLVSPQYGIKGRSDAVRRDMPVELKTGKNTNREPRFPDKIQAAAYALMLGEREEGVADTGTLLYTKNAALDRADATGDLSPAKEFSIGAGLRRYVIKARNAIALAEVDGTVPTGEEADAACEYCFERDTCMVVAGRLDQRSKAGAIGSPLPAAERAYFERFAALIEAERTAVKRDLAELWRQDAPERAAADRALIDLDPDGRRRLDDGRWELRAKGTGAVSKIRTGDVVLASDGDPIGGRAEVARVERVDETVVVTVDEPIDLRRLDVYPSEFGTDRQLAALHDFVLKADEHRRDLLLGRAAPRFGDIGLMAGEHVPTNPDQDRAVRSALAAEDFALIHGPPGTGKTYTIARLVRALRSRGERVLLAAFTNRAVDNALEAIREQGLEDVVRMGTTSGVRDDMLDVRLDPRGDPGETAGQLREAGVVAATASGCGSRELATQDFDVAVVDEASQLTEPGALAAINRADRFVLVGDHRQLPPVVRSDTGLAESLFERLIRAAPDAAVTLSTQYRMAQAIQAFPSQEFYDGALRPATSDVASRSPVDVADPTGLPAALRRPVAFVDVPGDSEAADGATDDGRHTNPAEADRVAELVSIYEAAGVDRADIGVITPYRAQVAAIDQRLPSGVTVDTVDRFQGSSKAVVIISFVATGALDGPLFEDERRLNVALTRARSALVLVGDRNTLTDEPLYARMVDWAESV